MLQRPSTVNGLKLLNQYCVAFSPRFEDQARGGAHRSAAVRHIGQHNRHRADAAIVANFDATQDLRVSAYFDVITQHRDGTVHMTVTDRDTLAQRAICANLRLRMDEDTAEMPDPKAWTNIGRFRQADAGCSLHQTKRQPIQRGLKLFQNACRLKVNAATATIKPDRPDRLLLEKWSLHTIPNQITLPITHSVPNLFLIIWLHYNQLLHQRIG